MDGEKNKLTSNAWRRGKAAACVLLSLFFFAIESGAEDGAPLASVAAGASLSSNSKPPIALPDLLSAFENLSKNPALLQQALEEIQQAQADAPESRAQLLERLRAFLEGLPNSEPEASAPPSSLARDNSQREIGEVREQFSQRFENEIFPLLASGVSGCFSCHGENTKTPLQLLADGRQTFLRLLQKQYFDSTNPSSLLAKLTATKESVRMPPAPLPPMAEERIQIFRTFVHDLVRAIGEPDQPWDERFPDELREPYLDSSFDKRAEGNSFLTFYQLKGKIQTLFGDDWLRHERDMFQENIEMFGGADFYARFNESDKPSARYLAGLDLLGMDVASKSYLNRSGPMAGLPADLPDPMASPAPDERFRETVTHLYQRLLVRDPWEDEIQEAFQMMREICREYETPSDGPSPLDFEVAVTGEAGVEARRNFTIQVDNTSLALQQAWLNENTDSDETWSRWTMPSTFHFQVRDTEQRVILSNRDTLGTVSFAGIEIKGPLPNENSRFIGLDDSSIKLRGPWNLQEHEGAKVIHDGNEQKGECSVEVPIAVEQDGEYALTVQWYEPSNRRGKKLKQAERVLMEVYSYDENHLLLPELPEVPPKGEARFLLDETDDTIAFWNTRASFRFGPDDYVEINNENTTRRVTADAIQFIPTDGSEEILVDDPEAEGIENWPVFTEYEFRPYHITGGHAVNDRIERKGEIFLRYRPSIRKDVWDAGRFYRVLVGFPGQARNETRVPVVVKAQSSSPIVRLAYSYHAPVGAEMDVDASSSYDVEHSALTFAWRQIGGPEVQIEDPHAARLRFKVAPRGAQQAAWEGLVRALIRHPDFVFSRPVSLPQVRDEMARKRLLLVKIAQDLVARPPTPDELATLDDGGTLEELIDRYLASREFESFYFRRIRLYLESQGTDEEDEPVRLWCYVMEHDLPFQEIVTADYSVDATMERVSRPAYYGHTGILTMKGFIKGKPGLPHFNYAAQVAEKFLGYVFEVPPEIVNQREGATAAATTSPDGICYSCHKILTPLAMQRQHWTDDGVFRAHDDHGLPIDDSDQDLVASYPFKGNGMEAFALALQRKERFIRTMIATHYLFYFGRQMRLEEDERDLYFRLWNTVHEQHDSIKGLIKSILLSPEYLGKDGKTVASTPVFKTVRP